MPCGRSIILWAFCDRCGEGISSDYTDRGGKRDAADMARSCGWTIRKNGEAICDKCKERKRIRNEKNH